MMVFLLVMTLGVVESQIVGPVKRNDVFAMDAVVALILGTHDDLDVFINSCGILITPFLTKHVTHVICDRNDDLMQYDDILSSAYDMNIPVVDKSFLTELVNADVIDDIETYLVPDYNKRPIKPFTQWIGVKCSDNGIQTIIQLTILLLNIDTGTFWGNITYPTTQKNFFKVKGQVKNTNISFEEYHPHSRNDEQSIFSSYVGVIKGKHVKGTYNGGIFNLHLYNLIREKEIPLLEQGTTWEGYTVTEHPFTYQVSSSEKNILEGEINWTSNEISCKTKYKGSLSGNDVEFQEYEAIEGAENMEISKKYRGRYNKDTQTITGTYTSGLNPRNLGNFEIIVPSQ
eukprot:TRINITY_DN4989_c0_g1_i3.p1 TRINITY_DN4989_c0_g1~~TRINITY_DN4989_c0_g1_i3.p1  ORF type:complete len:343 (+),score=68.69 TRINITY_DN4989_c0_g1_i3:185-1213(+)